MQPSRPIKKPLSRLIKRIETRALRARSELLPAGMRADARRSLVAVFKEVFSDGKATGTLLLPIWRGLSLSEWAYRCNATFCYNTLTII